MKIHRFTLLSLSVFLLWGCKQLTEAGQMNESALSYAGTSKDSIAIIARKALLETDATTTDKALSNVLSTANLGYREIDSAISILKEARAILIKEDKEQAAIASSLLGTFYQMTLHKDSTLKYFRDGEKGLDGKTGYYSYFRQLSYAGLGLFFTKNGEFEKSIQYYKNALDLGVTTQDYAGLSNVYLEIEDWEMARHYAKKSLELAFAANDKIRLMMCTDIVATSFAKQGQYDSANHYNRLALQLMGNSPHRLQMLFHSAEYSMQLGNRREAINSFREVIGLAKDSPYTRLRPFHYNSLANAYIGLIQDSVFFYSKKAHALAILQYEKKSQKTAASILAEHFKKMNQLDSAYYYLDQSAALQEILFRDDLANQLADLRVEIQTLEQEKELQIAKNERMEAINQRTQIVGFSGSGFLMAMILFIGYRHRNLKKQLSLEHEKENLTFELERNKQLLSNQMLNMIHKNNGFTEIAENLKNGDGEPSTKIKRIIDVNMALEKDWENFNMYFSQVHGNFNDKLKKQHPNLSITEMRLSSMVKMGLKNKEMATILNIEYSSITMAKYRLKKKLNLEEKGDLDSFIHSL